MLRRLLAWMARFSFVLVVGALGTVLGAAGAVAVTPAGHALLARVITAQSHRLVRGGIVVTRLRGNLLSRVVLDSVEVRDTTGFPLATVGRVEARYRLSNLLGGRIVLDELRLVRPRIHLVKHREGRLNFEEILRLGEGNGDGGPPQLLEFRNVTIEDGIVTLRTPWSPPGQLRTRFQRDSALRAQRQTPGRRIEDGGVEGLMQVRALEGLSARFDTLRIQNPTRDPLRVVIDSFAAVLSDPLITLQDARGVITTAGDSLSFELTRARLPRTELVGDGVLSWPRDTLLFNFEFRSAELALEDLRFVSPEFPDLTGEGRVAAYSFSGIETEYDIRDLNLAADQTRIAGSLVALGHKLRGLGFRGLALQFQNMDLDIPRAYLDTIPFTGRMSGDLRADGYYDRMRVRFDWTFADTRVADLPPNRIAMEGDVTLGGDAGVAFLGTRVTAADLDLETVRLAAPAVILEGRVTGEGTLDGPWRDVIYRGRMVHRDGDRPETIASGTFGLDTRTDTTRFDTDFAVTPLAFDGIRPSFPSVTATGQVWGPVRLRGPVDRLEVQWDLQGELGRLRADGVLGALPPRWTADPLDLSFEELDLARLRGTGDRTRLNGTLRLQGTIDSAVAPDGRALLALNQGWFREIRFDSAGADITVQDSVIQVDTAVVRWAAGGVAAGGTLGWTRPHQGRLRIGAGFRSLAAFDSVVTALLGVETEPGTARQRLDGSAVAELELAGALDSFTVSGRGNAQEVVWNGVRIPRADGLLDWRADSTAGVRARFRADSLTVGELRYSDLGFDLTGTRDLMLWEASGVGVQSRARVGGTLSGPPAGRELGVSRVDLLFGRSDWQLVEPVSIGLGDSLVLRGPMMLRTRDGAGSLFMEGVIPHRGQGDLDLSLFGVDLRSVAALIQRDTAELGGLLQADLRVGGTARSPFIRGTAAITGPLFGSFRAPLTRAALNYRDRRLDANLNFWRTGQQVMEVAATLPVEMAWMGVEGPRRLPGDLAIRARADSMDLATVEAFTTNLRRVSGRVRMDVTVSGAWDDPQLGGNLAIEDGYGRVPVLRVGYGPVTGGAHLTGNQIVIDSLRIGGEGGGRMDIGGSVELEELTLPVFDLDLTGDNFRMMNLPEFLELEADGSVRLTGPVTHPVMTGTARAENSVLYFSDLVTKTIVNLEDPLYADLVDTAAIRQRGLGAGFQSRFLDSLTIRDFTFDAGERVWLRSSEANIQMEGQVTVNKVRRNYRLEGTFSAPRGTYTLRLGPVTKAFDVRRGIVRYFGTPDLNASLDIEARHLVKSSETGSGSDLEVIANIGGTLLTPTLRLESTIRPPLSQSDLISLLIVGRPINQQVGTRAQDQTLQTAAAILAGAVTTELERTLVQSDRAGLDMVEIRPGLAYSGLAAGSSLSRVAAGWQVGSRWFLTLAAGFCPGLQQFDYRNFGAGLEYRLTDRITFAATIEPVQLCIAGQQPGPIRHQFGTDIRWLREYR